MSTVATTEAKTLTLPDERQIAFCMDRISFALGEYLRRERTARGWSQQQMAILMGTSRGMIVHIESGTRKVSFEWLVRLGVVFGQPFALHFMANWQEWSEVYVERKDARPGGPALLR